MFRKILKNQFGISMIEVIVAGAIAVGIAVGIAKMGQNASKSATKMKLDSEIADFKNYLKTNFARGQNCTKTFEDKGLEMKTPGGLYTDSLVPPSLATGATPEYHDLTTINIVTHTDSDGVTTNKFPITVGSPLRGAPNWTLRELRVYQMANPAGGAPEDENTGICSIYYKVERNKGINSKRSFGSSELTFWTTVSCSVHPPGVLAAVGVAGEMAYCQENQAVVPGHWVLKSKDLPTNGIFYGLDVYFGQDIVVGRHVIVESDERIKRNTVVIDRATEKLSEINGFYYFLRHEDFPHKTYSKERQIGFLAQQLEKTFPEAVKTNEKTGFKSVRYSMLVPVLVEAHKEQEKKIKFQAKQIKSLNRKIDLLIKEIHLLK